MMHDSSRSRAAVPATVAALMLLASTAYGQSLARFDLPAQPLADALKAVADQTSTNVLFDRKQIEGLNAPALRAQMTVQDALARLLTGSGLVPKFVSETTVVLAVAAEGVPAARVEETDGGLGLRLAQVDGAAAGYGSEAGQNATDSTKLEEIVVTAQKKEEMLQDVPIPVTVLNADDLAKNGQVLLRDYYSSVPGLNLSPAAAGQTFLSIRGISTGGITPTVGLVVDDVPFGSSNSFGGSLA